MTSTILSTSSGTNGQDPVIANLQKRTPRGGVTLNRQKTSGYKRGRRVISLNECMSKDNCLAL